MIKRCNKIAKQEGIEQRQTYQQTKKKLLLKQRFAHHPKRKKEAKSAMRKLRTIAGRLVRELERKLDQETFARYEQELKNCFRVIKQKKAMAIKFIVYTNPIQHVLQKEKLIRNLN